MLTKYKYFTAENCKKDKDLQNSTSPFKAIVSCMTCQGKQAVLKDYSHANFFLRKTICRFLIKREILALKRLQGVSGVPKFLGEYGEYGFLVEAIGGKHPNNEFFLKNSNMFLKLKDLIDVFHLRGVTHNDLRKSNIIVNNENEIFVIDYAAAFPLGRRANFIRNIAFDILVIMDKAKILRIVRDYSAYKLTEEDREIMRKAKRLHIAADAWRFFQGFCKNKIKH